MSGLCTNVKGCTVAVDVAGTVTCTSCDPTLNYQINATYHCECTSAHYYDANYNCIGHCGD